MNRVNVLNAIRAMLWRMTNVLKLRMTTVRKDNIKSVYYAMKVTEC